MHHTARRFTNYIAALLISIFLLPSPSQAVELTTYLNSEFNFQFSYPASWKHTSCDGTTQEGTCGHCGGCKSDFFGSDYLAAHAKRASLEELFSDDTEMFKQTEDGHTELAVPMYLGSENISGKDWNGIIFSYACSSDEGRFDGVCYEGVVHRNGVSIVLDVGNSLVQKSTLEQIMKSITFADH